MQAIDTERSPGWPSLMVTTRRRFIPHGTSCSFLQAVTQALHSIQRSASQRNFIRAMVVSSRRRNLAKGCLWLLHASHRIEAVGCNRVDALAQHDRIGSFRILAALIDPLEPAGEVERAPSHTLANALCDERLHSGAWAGVGGTTYPDPCSVLDAA